VRFGRFGNGGKIWSEMIEPDVRDFSLIFGFFFKKIKKKKKGATWVKSRTPAGLFDARIDELFL
jgi:hypothetical protein